MSGSKNLIPKTTRHENAIIEEFLQYLKDVKIGLSLNPGLYFIILLIGERTEKFSTFHIFIGRKLKRFRNTDNKWNINDENRDK